MGYYTRYSLDIAHGETTIEQALAVLSAITDYGDSIFDVDGESYEPVKWYDHEEDMVKLSKLFPDTVFVLYGEGEESGDIWKKYFKNGKIQRCCAVITFEPYDESKLEDPKMEG